MKKRFGEIEFIDFLAKMSARASRIICNSKIGNFFVQVGVPPGGGVLAGRLLGNRGWV